jgi:hypothetical protein
VGGDIDPATHPLEKAGSDLLIDDIVLDHKDACVDILLPTPS